VLRLVVGEPRDRGAHVVAEHAHRLLAQRGLEAHLGQHRHLPR
jgi:hypothetical protein